MRGVFAAVVLTALVAQAAPARAQDDAAATSEARASFAQGVEAFEAERYTDALAHFRKAWQLRPHPTVRVNLASCYAKLGKAPAALMHYRAYLADRSVQISRADRREVQTSMRELEPNVGILDVGLTPADAQLRVDGEVPEARDGARVYLTPGSHRLEASAPGRASQTRTVDVTGGSTQSVTIALAVQAAAPPPPARPAPEPTPPPPEPSDEAPAPVEVEPEVEPVVEPVGDDPVPERSSSSRGGGSTALRWTAFSLAGAAAAGAVVLGVLALGAESDFDDGATRIENGDYADETERAAIERQARDDADRASTLALVTDVCIGVAVVGAVTGTILLLTAPSAVDRDDEVAALRLRVAASPTRGGAAIVLAGSL